MRFAVDVQLLLYAHHAVFPQHSKARAWLKHGLSETEGFAVPWECLLSYVRLSVKRGILPVPIDLPTAWADVQAMLSTGRVWLAEPTAQHRATLDRLLPLVTGQGNDITDVHIAAICIEHRLTLCTNDSGFDRFAAQGLRLHNPLA